MYIKADVKRPSGAPGKGLNPRDSVVLIDIDDIAYFPNRNEAGVVVEEDVVLKPGAYGIEIYMTPGTVELTSASEGDPDAEGYTPSLKFNHPGNEREVREFKTNWLGRNCIAFVRYCSGKATDMLGSPCNPMRLTSSYTGNNEQNMNEMTLTQAMKGDDIAIYEGTVPLSEPVATVTGGSTSVTYGGDGRYQLSSGEAVLATITGGSHGAIVTLVGCGGTSPTVATATDILLKEGKTWTGSEGSLLTLKAFKKAAEGEHAIVWIEQSRYEA